jgi:transposase
MAGANRNSYDIGASEEVQARVKQLSGQITSLITQHETNVKALLSDATATGVTDSYREIESKFSSAAADTLKVIQLLTDTLRDNDETARTALKQAQAAVEAIPH